MVFLDDYQFACEKNDLRRRMMALVDVIESSPARRVSIALKARAFERKDVRLWQWAFQVISLTAAIAALITFLLTIAGIA